MRNLFWGVTLVLIGVLILLDNLGFVDFGDVIGRIWPLFLVLWGLSILMRHRPASSSRQDTAPPVPPLAEGNPTSSSVEADLIHQSTVFGDLISRIASRHFKGGSISTVFGDSHIDISSAEFEAGDHELRLHSVFGNTTIILRPGAPVSISASSLIGELAILGERKGGFSSDLHVESPSYAPAGSRLKVSVSKVFGNIRVEYSG